MGDTMHLHPVFPRRFLPAATLAAIVACSPHVDTRVEGPIRSALTGHAPSSFGHVTDGAFTDLDGNPSNGTEEWSDLTPTSFPASKSFLYADQTKLRPG